jgi:ATP-binding cassette subfamily F protein 3
LIIIPGSYDQFDNERRTKLEQQHSMKRKQDAQRAHIESFVERFRAKASKARQAQSRLKQLEKMQPDCGVNRKCRGRFQVSHTGRATAAAISGGKGTGWI